MKAIIVLVLTATVISMVAGGRVFTTDEEKENAKKAVKKNYEEAESFIQKITRKIQDECGKKDDNSKNDATDTLNKIEQETKQTLEKNAIAFTRTAIAKGKPIQVIECIGLTSTDVEKMIQDTKVNSLNAIENVLSNKSKKLDILRRQINMILQGLTDLKNQNLKEIDGMKTGFDKVVADASRKVESAKKLLREIEIRVTKPLLSDEYTAARKKIESDMKEITDYSVRRLQKCVA